MSDQYLPLPPYGKILQAYIDANINIMIEIYTGKNSALRAKKGLSMCEICTYLPFESDYFCYFWPIKNQTTLIYNDGIKADYIRKMAIDLFVQYQPKRLIAYIDKSTDLIVLDS